MAQFQPAKGKFCGESVCWWLNNIYRWNYNTDEWQDWEIKTAVGIVYVHTENKQKETRNSGDKWNKQNDEHFFTGQQKKQNTHHFLII